MNAFRWMLFVALVTLSLSGCSVATQGALAPTPSPTAISNPTSLPVNTPIVSPFPLPTLRGTLTLAEEGTAVSGPTLAKLIAQAQADLAQRAKVAAKEITVVKTIPTEWPDSALGCPKPGVMYSQVVTPGYQIVLSAGGKEYDYHTARDRVILCEK